ncbi:hypothetical protein [Herbiconiux ginsengi]|uniref:Uncharacterized protein n=1 Tax=Herbiconiux ginsengi TaxID=381665 RepID=A0A1H3PG59_9MICO|nr:hypothetical protein [Herbiconiux ginsengi]SDZ00090.1 hypothetical protein SAMN05216554_1876 [Herbiconiux ginsengi]
MASSAGTKCPVCGKSVAVGLVSQTLIQHEDKTGQRCSGSGQAPVVSAARAAAATRSAGRPSSGSSTTRSSGGSGAKRSSPATRGSLTVRKVEVDPEALRERQERSERLRQERAAAARERNEVNVSYFDEPGV